MSRILKNEWIFKGICDLVSDNCSGCISNSITFDSEKELESMVCECNIFIVISLSIHMVAWCEKSFLYS